MDISVVEVFQYPTIHAMAEYISQKQQKTQAEPEEARGEKRTARRAASQRNAARAAPRKKKEAV